MKIIAFISVMALISFVSLSGQTDKPDKRFNYQKYDTLIKKPLFRNPVIDDPDKKFDLQRGWIINPDSALIQKHFSLKPVITEEYRDILSAERFPGSERYYAKRPYISYPYEKSFVKTPDSSVKYYLIIKDPLTLRRIDRNP